MAVRNNSLQGTGQVMSTRDAAVSNTAAASPERFDPTVFGGQLVEAEHLARYLIAAQFVAGRDVLDVGCGQGWGSALLADSEASRCVGVDIDEVSIAAASKAYPHVTEFVVDNMETLSLPPASFDVIVCLEAIEHVLDPERALDAIRRVLRADGLLVLSSPNPSVYPPGNPHHVHEYPPGELAASLGRRFKHVSLLRQHSFLASLVGDAAACDEDNRSVPLEAALYKIASVREGEQMYTIAMASDAALPACRPTAVLASPLELRSWHKRLAEHEAAVARAEDLEGRVRQLSDRLLEAERRMAHVLVAEAQAEELKRILDSRSWQLIQPPRRVLQAVRRLVRGRRPGDR